ncbi:DMT family transporter [Streptomyces sp. NBC_00257]|uniref:DMT family transporter n=1 Tax=unclassified Streptomyces TaxID=2593676 RepID=UPI0022531950|nr:MULTISPECIES: DMT family transporter [unclassified Streptomyces]WTB58609.1 DMT family transporter [Streptomyces sp. NBC_00826]WTH88513.1 DMT family transporter [Streptomyces sp. NBC_00825]WTH97242.1 DMT family transporter [Streptomyces sp. NBC_00822]MCX4862745.1 DMT family transporter [Streptomyces sp. NBC_00906]MCX4893982.1 DMT family transporter [Streptomyces sp. NBC_00892]
MSSLALSVLLSLISAVAYAAGAIVQERVATTGGGHSPAPLRNRVWWVAVALNGVGAVLHVVALAYGPLSLVQPLGALTIVFALPMAALFVGRRAGATAWRGAIMATVGLAGLLALTGNAESHALNGRDQLIVAGATLGAVALLLLISTGVHRPVVRSVVLAGAAGIAFGIASVFTKTVAVGLSSGAVGAGLPALLAIAGFAATGLLVSQAAYRGAGLTAPLATVTVVNPVIAAVVGLTMFGEQFRHGTAGTMLAPACAVLAAGGLILLTTERLGAEHRAAQAADDGLPDARADGEPVGMGHDDVEHEDVAATEAAPGPSAPGGTAEAARGTFSAVRRPMPVLMPLECLGRVVFGPGMSRYTGPAGPADPDDAADPQGAVQTLTPPALR